MSLLLTVMAGDIGFAVRICFHKRMTEVATERRIALSLMNCINRSNIVIAKIVIGFVVGGGGVVFFVNHGNLTSFAILVNCFELDCKSHGLMQRVFVGLHNFAMNRFIEAGQKQLMLEELLRITNPFYLHSARSAAATGTAKEAIMAGTTRRVAMSAGLASHILKNTSCT